MPKRRTRKPLDFVVFENASTTGWASCGMLAMLASVPGILKELLSTSPRRFATCSHLRCCSRLLDWRFASWDAHCFWPL